LSRGKRTRLTDSPEFERVYRQGVAYRGRLFSVHAFPNELGTPRLGLSVSRRVGNAVTRNTVRRRLGEVFYAALPEVPGGLDLVVSARPPAAEASFRELGEEFDRALRRLGEAHKVQEAEPR
jgi:ribonuclease P protein component